MIPQVWLWRNRIKPIDMLDQLGCCLFNIIEARLDPLEPITFQELWWHDDALTLHTVLECIYAVLLILSYIVPAVVDTPIILSLHISSNHILTIWYEEVDFRWWNIHCILAIVARIIGIVWIRMFDRLLQLLQVFGIRPFFVPVSCLLLSIFHLFIKLFIDWE